MCVLRGRGGMLCAWFWVVSSEGFVCVVLGCRWWVVLKEGVYGREDVCVVARETLPESECEELDYAGTRS